MSRIEQFIREHRGEFDQEAPPAAGWKNIQQQLNPAPARGNGRLLPLTILRWSAAAAILVLAGLGVYHLVDRQPTAPTARTQENAKEKKLLQDINPEYATEVYHFTRLIELKQDQLKQIEKDNPDLYKTFTGDINKLDSSYNELKEELPTNPNREQLLEAMIENLKLQADLLNQQLQIIHQIKQAKQNKDDKII
ncbi:MAG: hypothetical protein P0Y53_22675 [Candidatus Pseudobacter hemicellulosilyticus]|uniref:Anti-sigma factor n=1 Tax=Candidatus Pseudobacter hemicellulosilyticus TaxID=3121375 RepID=A0AAJ5WNP4_9BACT|nr:MAG: hypothetical protein P0Y53_22675 [Pseudobacter sp.]